MCPRVLGSPVRERRSPAEIVEQRSGNYMLICCKQRVNRRRAEKDYDSRPKFASVGLSPILRIFLEQGVARQDMEVELWRRNGTSLHGS